MDDPVSPAWRQRNELRAWKREKMAARVGLTLSEYIDRGQRNVERWSKGGVRIRLCERALRDFLSDGQYKVMAETGRSGGQLRDPEIRLKTEQDVLGLALDAPWSERPTSAYLEGSDETGAIRTYGPIRLELRPAIRERCWLVLGDFVDDIRLGFSEVFCPTALVSPGVEAGHLSRDIATPVDLADACGDRRYAEILVFGGLVPADVAVIRYPDDIAPDPEIVELVARETALYQGATMIKAPSGGLAEAAKSPAEHHRPDRKPGR